MEIPIWIGGPINFAVLLGIFLGPYLLTQLLPRLPRGDAPLRSFRRWRMSFLARSSAPPRLPPDPLPLETPRFQALVHASSIYFCRVAIVRPYEAYDRPRGARASNLGEATERMGPHICAIHGQEDDRIKIDGGRLIPQPRR